MAVNTKTYITKSNTIIRESAANTALNPVMELNYGKMLTRGMLYFDHTKVKKMVEDKVYPDISKLRHVLRMTNASSVRDRNINCPTMDSEYHSFKQRAISFDVILFLIPREWDEGRGFDYVYDLYEGQHRAVSTDGSNWYKFRNYCKWDEDGIYTTDTLSRELDKFTSKNGNLSDVIISYQHFDKGNEPLEIDITDTFNKFMTGELCNYGLGIAFSPAFENVETEMSQYVGFFTQHTNSFFEPYVETTYDEVISDDRPDFFLDKDNRLYFYATVGGRNVNLDEMPTCSVNGEYYEVRQATKGIYYIEIRLSSEEYEPDTMYYDLWSNLRYNGRAIPDTELQFTTKAPGGYFSFGLPTAETKVQKFVPYLYGISNAERIRRGDVRKINIDCKIPYTSDQLFPVDSMEYRLYVKVGEREYDVIEYSPVERAYDGNYFLVKTDELIPSRYYVDIKVTYDFEKQYHREMLQFDIVSDARERYGEK